MKRLQITLTLLVLFTACSVSNAFAFGVINWEKDSKGNWLYQDDKFFQMWLDGKNAPAERQSSFSGMAAAQSFDVYALGGLAANKTSFGTAGNQLIIGGNSHNNWNTLTGGNINKAVMENVQFGDLCFTNWDNKTYSLADANLTTRSEFTSAANQNQTIKSYSLWQLTDDWMGFTKGSWILGIEDKAGQKESVGGSQADYNDIVLVFTAHPTPIPGAVWLLGSGLTGLVAMRRRAGK